eukprot:6190632-Pleurochrysis_carterae.AAC.1
MKSTLDGALSLLLKIILGDETLARVRHSSVTERVTFAKGFYKLADCCASCTPVIVWNFNKVFSPMLVVLVAYLSAVNNTIVFAASRAKGLKGNQCLLTSGKH